ncbi:MAG: TonB-dependent receptor, partial [Rudanella sp.]|nr:TonB-dependent receptor [Rudanella sp.]
GLNWDVKGDRSFQVRGGTGIFTGRVPFVWISNQISNNGVLFGTIARVGQAANANIPFSLDPVAQGLPASLTAPAGTPQAPTFSINATVPDFKFPQVWRTSFGIDKTLPGGWVATFDAIYTKDINAVSIRDANLASPAGTLAGDGRPVFGGVAGTAVNPPFDRRINDRIVQALVLSNVNQGYALSMTGQIQKRFSRGFEGSLAYTYTDSKDLYAQSASTAGTLFTGQQIVSGPNSPNLSYSNNLVPHRIVGFVQYRKEYLKYFATTVSLIYTGQNIGNFTYTYLNSPNSDGINGNDLIYIPRNQNEIVLATTNAQDTRTTQQIWDQLNTYIDQDAYLSKRRGQYAERNGAYLPWQNLFNFRLLQDLFVPMPNGRRHTIQLSVDLINAGNFLNSNWGITKATNRANLLNFTGYETPNTATAVTTGRPIYSFAEAAPGQALSSTFTNNFTLSARWQLQLGARYIF